MPTPFQGSAARGEAPPPRDEGLLLGPPEPPPGWPIIAELGPTGTRPNASAERSPPGEVAVRNDEPAPVLPEPVLTTAGNTENTPHSVARPPLAVVSMTPPAPGTESFVPRASARLSPSSAGGLEVSVLSRPLSFASSLGTAETPADLADLAWSRFSSGPLGFGLRAEHASNSLTQTPSSPPLRPGVQLAERLRCAEQKSGAADLPQPAPTTAERTSADPPRRQGADAQDGGERALSEERAPEPTTAAPDIARCPAAATAPPHQVETMAPSTVKAVDLEQCLLAFSNALQATHERNGRDVLHVVLTAQQEHLAQLMQAIADQRLDYREQIERAIQGYEEQLRRAAQRMSDELNPEAILQIGELFHTSAGQITGALARTERLSVNMLEKQSRLIEGLGTLTGQVSKLLTVVAELRELGLSLAGSPAPKSPQHPPTARETERRLSLVAGRPDVLADIRDDLDDDDDI
jgi:hypothetical protein